MQSYREVPEWWYFILNVRARLRPARLRAPRLTNTTGDCCCTWRCVRRVLGHAHECRDRLFRYCSRPAIHHSNRHHLCHHGHRGRVQCAGRVYRWRVAARKCSGGRCYLFIMLPSPWVTNNMADELLQGVWIRHRCSCARLCQRSQAGPLPQDSPAPNLLVSNSRE